MTQHTPGMIMGGIGIDNREEAKRAAAIARIREAAPQMLEALQEFCHYYNGKEHQLGNGQARKSLDRFRATIRQATGE